MNMANPKGLTDSVDNDFEEDPEVPEEEETSNDLGEDPEDHEVNEDEETHCSQYGCRYFLVTVVIVYFGIIGVGCFFIYLGRFSVLRGIDHVTEKFNSFTYAHFDVVTGRDPV